MIDAASSHRLETALAWIDARERRDEAFGAELFFDPVWNMLLDLYVHHHRQAAVSVSSLCIAAKVPATTALRWLTLMERKELVRRRDDDCDRRRSHISLTAPTLARLELVLDHAAFAGHATALESAAKLK